MENTDSIRQVMTVPIQREDALEVARLARQRSAVDVKIARIQRGESIRVVDLFAGCGGMSLGFRRANFTILGGVEKDPRAAQIHATNFFSSDPSADYRCHEMPRNIRTFTPTDFMQDILHATQPELEVDVIVGGPPCQAFARIGRAKLREISQHPNAHLNDDRASLYIPYLSYVEFFRPLAVLMENVPDIMNHGGQNVAEDIADLLEEMGYRCRYTILNAANYGVPQMRQRFFLVALLDDLDIDPSFPEPTHYIQPSAGYTSAHHAALNADRQPTRYIDPPVAPETLLPAVTVETALADLPFIPNPTDKRQNKKKLDILARYKNVEPSDYTEELRNWPDFPSTDGVLDHVTRHLPRDYPIFERMKPGDEYPQAHKIALRLFRDALKKHIIQDKAFRRPRRTNILPRDTEDKRSMRLQKLKELLRKAIVPPYDHEKFPNKWWKLIPNRPSRTLTAHIGKDTYTHIHYDPCQPRVISVREAARLQSFPDGFKFGKSMNAAFTQIGNAVPPILAYKLANHIKELLHQSAHYDGVTTTSDTTVYARHIEITDLTWQFLEPLMPPLHQGPGRPRENRKRLNGILYALQRDSAWKNIPSEYGGTTTCKKYLHDWEETGVWLHICRTLQILVGDQSGVCWKVLLLGSKAGTLGRPKQDNTLEHQQTEQASDDTCVKNGIYSETIDTYDIVTG